MHGEKFSGITYPLQQESLRDTQIPWTAGLYGSGLSYVGFQGVGFSLRLMFHVELCQVVWDGRGILEMKQNFQSMNCLTVTKLSFFQCLQLEFNNWFET